MYKYIVTWRLRAKYLQYLLAIRLIYNAKFIDNYENWFPLLRDDTKTECDILVIHSQYRSDHKVK